MINKPTFLIVSGNGRDSGKTSFVCDIISAHRNSTPLTAIKVSPHFHAGEKRGKYLYQGMGYNISIEEKADGGKDTARMLGAGASKVYYIEAKDANLQEALRKLLPLIPTQEPVICESAAMRDFIIPSLFILINRDDGRIQKESYTQKSPLADRHIIFKGKDFDINPESFRFDGSVWGIQKTN